MIVGHLHTADKEYCLRLTTTTRIDEHVLKLKTRTKRDTNSSFLYEFMPFAECIDVKNVFMTISTTNSFYVLIDVF